jgi:hypothetical protein
MTAGSTASKSYSLHFVDATFAGIDLKRGCGESDFITVKYATPRAVLKVSADGEGAIITTLDVSGDVEIVLGQTSLANDDLSGVANAGIDAGAVQVGAFSLRDRSGLLAAQSPDAFIIETPDVKRAKETGEYTWKLKCAHLRIQIRGNPSIATG